MSEVTLNIMDAYRATSQPHHLTTLYELARSEAFAQAHREKLPDEPDLPLKTLRLALNGAIKVEQPEVMAEMLLRHARRVATAESPLLAWRQSKERAIQLAGFVFEHDYKIGTLWLLLLAWRAVRNSEQEWAQRCLIQIRQRWEGGAGGDGGLIKCGRTDLLKQYFSVIYFDFGRFHRRLRFYLGFPRLKVGRP